jgi:putative ABC transport system ATP-binding protein
MSKIIELKGIIKKITSRHLNLKYTIFDKLCLSIEPNSINIIKGASGVGKTTLLKIMSLLDDEFEGEVVINGIDMAKKADGVKSKFIRENIGFIFQDYLLIPELTIKENVMLPLQLLKEKKCGEKAEKILCEVGVMDTLESSKGGFLNKYPYELSGGQQQRVAVARSLVSNSQIIFCDEPTGNLDIENKKMVVDCLVNWCRNDTHKSKTLIVVTHDNPSFFERSATSIFELRRENVNSPSKIFTTKT